MRRLVDQVRVPFRNRGAAGEALARRLARTSLDPSAVVLAIPPSGVAVAAVVAHRLGLPLDVLVAHRINAPWHRDLELGAVAADGTRVIDAGGAVWLGDSDAIRDAATTELDLARELEHWLRGGRPSQDLHGRTVVLVDDGMAIGATMETAVLSARRSGAERVVVAVPVASLAAETRLEAVADAVVVVATPDPFESVGRWYEEFAPVTDHDAAALLAEEMRTRSA